MNIEKGMKFKNHWIGHEDCYKDRIYEVRSVLSGCTCSRPQWRYEEPQARRRPHIHITARMIEGPFKDYEDHYFGPLDSETLKHIEHPETEWIEIINVPAGVQFSLF